MNDVPFHLTGMGRRFFESTMPALVEAIERLNTNLEQLLPRIEGAVGTERGATGDETPPGPADRGPRS